MADEDAIAPGKRASRRRRRVEGGRKHRHDVKVTPEEEALLLQRAAAQHVSIPRLLVESALSGGAETSSERRNAIEELFKIERALAGVANNINQIARTANTVVLALNSGGQVDESMKAGLRRDLPTLAPNLDALRRLAARIEDAIDDLSLGRSGV